MGLFRECASIVETEHNLSIFFACVASIAPRKRDNNRRIYLGNIFGNDSYKGIFYGLVVDAYFVVGRCSFPCTSCKVDEFSQGRVFIEPINNLGLYRLVPEGSMKTRL